MPNCCNCTLVDGMKSHPSTWLQSCDRSNAEKKDAQGNTARSRWENILCKFTTPDKSFAHPQQEPQVVQTSYPQLAATESMKVQPTRQQQQLTNQGQSVHASYVNSLPLNNMFRVTSVVQQIMTELRGAVSEVKIVPVTKIVINLMKHDGCWSS
jgi:hypothetical protein